jgi:hypothetical protein
MRKYFERQTFEKSSQALNTQSKLSVSLPECEEECRRSGPLEDEEAWGGRRKQTLIIK